MPHRADSAKTIQQFYRDGVLGVLDSPISVFSIWVEVTRRSGDSPRAVISWRDAGPWICHVSSLSAGGRRGGASAPCWRRASRSSWAGAATASAAFRLTDPSAGSYYDHGLLAGTKLKIGERATVTGNVHSNGTLDLDERGSVAGNATAVGKLTNRGTVSGTASSPAPALALPALASKDDLPAAGEPGAPRQPEIHQRGDRRRPLRGRGRDVQGHPARDRHGHRGGDLKVEEAGARSTRRPGCR